MKYVDKFINMTLLSHPMNWAVVWLVATIWLLAFHVIMQGFQSMQQTTFQNGPLPNGNVLAPLSSPYASSTQTNFGGVPSYG